MNLLELINNGRFVVTCEVGSPKGTNILGFLNTVDLVKNYVNAITIGDNQRAVMRAAPLAICQLLKARNVESVMELATRDRNRLALQSDLLGAGIIGVENLLLVTGHDLSVGDHVEAKPVYDLDCASLVKATSVLTQGKDLTGHALDGAPSFCIGVEATVGLRPAEEQLAMLQEMKNQGAQFIQTQPIYEPEVLERFTDSIRGLNMPVIVGHMTLRSASMANFMNSNLPGVHVPKEMIKDLEGLPREELVEKSLQLSIDLLKKMKPMCQGIHLMPGGWERYVPRIVDAVVG